jgi:hypothetical protein
MLNELMPQELREIAELTDRIAANLRFIRAGRADNDYLDHIETDLHDLAHSAKKIVEKSGSHQGERVTKQMAGESE